MVHVYGRRTDTLLSLVHRWQGGAEAPNAAGKRPTWRRPARRCEFWLMQGTLNTPARKINRVEPRDKLPTPARGTEYSRGVEQTEASKAGAATKPALESTPRFTARHRIRIMAHARNPNNAPSQLRRAEPHDWLPGAGAGGRVFARGRARGFQSKWQIRGDSP